jgi:hypothetical protein
VSSLASTLAKGIAAGLAGGAVMTAVENAEPALTGRPDSYVPGRTLAHLVGLRDPDSDRATRNLAMHFATAATAGVPARGHVGGEPARADSVLPAHVGAARDRPDA